MSETIGHKAIDLFVYLAHGASDIEFTFTGGEPLLAFSVVEELTKYAHKRAGEAGMESRFILKTNGTRLDADIIGFLKNYQVKVVVSIDGIQSVHDRFRRHKNGTDTHAKVCRNLSVLLREGVPCVASMTVHPDTVSMVAVGVRFLYELGVEQVDIGPVYDTAVWSTGQCLRWVQSLIETAEYVRHVHLNGGRLDVGPFYKNSDHRNGVLTDRWGCHAATSNLAFLPTGKITGCSALGMMQDRFPEVVLGDVADGLNQQAVDRLVGLAQASHNARSTCRECPTASNCTGGCLAINLGTNGKAFMPPEFYCSTIAAIPEAWDKAWGVLLP